MLESSHLPAYLRTAAPQSQPLETRYSALQEAERKTIITALQQSAYNRSAAAARLGMHKSTLFRKIRKLGITLPDMDGRHAKN